MMSCIEPYNPPAIDELVDILVVDGFLDSSNKTALVRLSKATALSDESDADNYVSGAFVQVEEESGMVQTLQELGNGMYVLNNADVSSDKKYRLTIQNVNNKRYLSEFIELTRTPEIDSVTWKPSTQQSGINILVNTHDDSGETEYYQWTFEETWEYTSRFGANYKIENGDVLPNDLNVFRCYSSRPSSAINVATTTQLSSDVISSFPLIFIPVGSQKISSKYSILVRQRGLTREAYNFWDQLKKSTENLGGLFDPLPSQLVGNVHAEGNKSEPVLGYFSGGETRERRIFVIHRDLPPELRVQPRIPCAVDSLKIAQIRNYPNMLLIVSYGMPITEGYTTSSEHNCMDCRDDGGVLDRPDFWD
jgi:hypothetical protein